MFILCKSQQKLKQLRLFSNSKSTPDKESVSFIFTSSANEKNPLLELNIFTTTTEQLLDATI